MKEDKDKDSRMPGDWTETNEDDEITGDSPIESDFRDGTQRVRDSDGKYKSVSDIIIEQYSHSNPPSPATVARDLDIKEKVAREHLEMLKQRGIIGYK